jgi:hypothetical protein
MPEAALPPSDLLGMWRSPSVRIISESAIVPGIFEAEVISTGCFAADRFSARLALDAELLYDAAFWGSRTDIQVDVQFSVDSMSYVSLISGRVDSVSIDAINRVAMISGRDLSAALIESRIQDAFVNQTASDVATLLASRHGLTPNVTPTTTLIGRYYHSEHDQLTLDQFSPASTEWDLLAHLARQEGFLLSVSGDALNFGPPIQSAPFTIDVTQCLDLRLDRCLPLARGVEVTVKSWNARQSSGFSQTATAVGAASSLPPQRYVFVYPNMTPDQALRSARARLSELTLHERTVEMTIPGELMLAPGMILVLTGTETEFDQAYQVESVERRFSCHTGFLQLVRARSGTGPQTA